MPVRLPSKPLSARTSPFTVTVQLELGNVNDPFDANAYFWTYRDVTCMTAFVVRVMRDPLLPSEPFTFTTYLFCAGLVTVMLSTVPVPLKLNVGMCVPGL